MNAEKFKDMLTSLGEPMPVERSMPFSQRPTLMTWDGSTTKYSLSDFVLVRKGYLISKRRGCGWTGCRAASSAHLQMHVEDCVMSCWEPGILMFGSTILRNGSHILGVSSSQPSRLHVHDLSTDTVISKDV